MDVTRCKERVMPRGHWHLIQCSRKHKKDGYCTQHHPDTVAAKAEAETERFAQKMANSPMAKLRRANEKIAELEAKLDAMDKFLESHNTDAGRNGGYYNEVVSVAHEMIKEALGEQE